MENIIDNALFALDFVALYFVGWDCRNLVIDCVSAQFSFRPHHQ